MSSHHAGLIELLLVFGAVLVWAVREWWKNRKWLKDQREKNR